MSVTAVCDPQALQAVPCPSAHPSSSLWAGEAKLKHHELCVRCPPVISGGFMVLGTYGFIFTTPGVHVKGKWN